MNAVENWRDVVGYEGLYQVSDLGRVMSLPQILKDYRVGDYRGISLGKGKKQSIHRLVAEAFLPPVEGKYTVDHINRDKLDNRLENLRWATPSEQGLNKEHRRGVSGERNIIKAGNSWAVQIKRKNLIVYQQAFKTIPEAVVARDNYLASI
jgi:hypothetical protein